MAVVKSNFTTAAQTANFFASLLPFGLGDAAKVKTDYQVATGDIMPADVNASYANNEYLDRVQNKRVETKAGPTDWTKYVSMVRGLGEDVVSSLYGAGGINNQLQDVGKSVSASNNAQAAPDLNVDLSGAGNLFGTKKSATPTQKPFNKAAFDQNQKVMERDLGITGNLYNPAGTMQTSSQNGFTMLDPSKWTLNT